MPDISDTTPGLQLNTEIESVPPGQRKNHHLRKYTVGTVLTFRSYDPDEVSTLGDQHVYRFRRGDKLVVEPRNGCGMGIDVRRVSDGQVDMVWPTEVAVSKSQTLPMETVRAVD